MEKRENLEELQSKRRDQKKNLNLDDSITCRYNQHKENVDVVIFLFRSRHKRSNMRRENKSLHSLRFSQR